MATTKARPRSTSRNGHAARSNGARHDADPRLDQRAPELQRFGTLRTLPIGLPDKATPRELRAAQRDPRRLDGALLAVQEAPLARRRPDLLPAPPAVRQARRGAERDHRRPRRARPEPGRHRRRRPAPRGRADHDPAAARRRRRGRGHDRPARCAPTRRSSRRSARRIKTTEESEDWGTNDLLMSDVLRRHELQVWFLAEHVVDVPLVG